MNTKAFTTVIGCVILAGMMLAMQACDLRSFVRVEVPKGVTQSLDLKPPIWLDRTDAIREDWVAFVETNTKRLDASIDAADARYAEIHRILGIGLETAGTASQGIPYGGIAFGALTGIAGLLMPQPKLARKAPA